MFMDALQAVEEFNKWYPQMSGPWENVRGEPRTGEEDTVMARKWYGCPKRLGDVVQRFGVEKPVTLGDEEDTVRWWMHNLVR